MILLVPIGPVPIYLISWLEDKLGLFVEKPVEVGKAVPLPRSGYDPDRHQYKGSSVLQLLRETEAPNAERLVGLIDQDCYAPGLNFIFGQAAAGGREAFVALPRLRPPCSGMEEDKNLFRDRILKEIVHELGHTWGLPHCDCNDCVMQFSNSIQDTEKKNAGFCSRCKEKLSL